MTTLLSLIVSWLLCGVRSKKSKPILTYREAIEYFSTKWPKDPAAMKAALLKKPSVHRETLTVSWMFLTERDKVCLSSNGLPYGQKIEVQAIDEELAALFGNEDLVILQ